MKGALSRGETCERVTVMGLGLFGGGAAVARHFAERGARVTVTDLRGAALLAPSLRELADLDLHFVLGEHREADFSQTDLVVANPAVKPANAFLEVARRSGVPVTSEAALFLDACPCEVIAITGTQGKSSTSHYLAQLLAQGDRKVHLGGNIGRPLLADLAEIDAADVCVLELSSYQLETLPDEVTRERASSPIVGAGVVNILSDHLERHGTRAAYARAKLRLLELVCPGGCAVLPGAPLPVEVHVPSDVHEIRHREVVELCQGAVPDVRPGAGALRIEDSTFWLNSEDLGRVDDVPFSAPFQLDNVCLALGLARLAGVSPAQLRRGLLQLRGLPHRLDRVGDLDERPLWDNGVSTTPDSTISALESVAPGMILIAGGQTKELELAPLIEVMRRRETQLVIFGKARASWVAEFEAAGVPTHAAETPRDALDLARTLTGSGVLFSPACASFDAYPNFKARALEFLAHAEHLGLRPPPAAEPGTLLPFLAHRGPR